VDLVCSGIRKYFHCGANASLEQSTIIQISYTLFPRLYYYNNIIAFSFSIIRCLAAFKVSTEIYTDCSL